MTSRLASHLRPGDDAFRRPQPIWPSRRRSPGNRPVGTLATRFNFLRLGTVAAAIIATAVIAAIIFILTPLRTPRGLTGLTSEIPQEWAYSHGRGWNVVWLNDGPTYTRLEPGADYIVMLPDGPKLGPTILEGGRNVVVPGGHIVMEGEQAEDQRAIYIKDATGTVQIRDVFIEGRDGVAFDAIAISAPDAVVELFDIRVEGVSGTYSGFHGDIVQPFGGVRELFVNGLTGRSNYQGFYLSETNGIIGSVTLRNVNLTYDDNPENETTYLLWLDDCAPYPVVLDNVFIEPRPGQRIGSQAVQPNDTQDHRCQARQEGDEVWWPDMPEVDGVVIEGTPPGGDFVPINRWRNG